MSWFMATARDVRAAIMDVLPAVCDEEDRKHGLLIETEDDEVHFVATDGHRVMRASVRPLALAQGASSIVIGQDVLRGPMMSVLKAAKPRERFIVELSGSDASIRIGDKTFVVTGGVDAKFPPYRRIVPEQYAWSFRVVDPNGLKHIVRAAASVLAHDKTRSHALVVYKENGEYTVSLQFKSWSFGTACAAAFAVYRDDGFPAVACKFALDARYLLDALMHLADARRGVLFAGNSFEDPIVHVAAWLDSSRSHWIASIRLKDIGE